MKIKLNYLLFCLRRRLLINIMRTFIFLFLTATFGFAPNNVLSQNAKIKIASDKIVTVDEIFDLIMTQTDYKFIYQEGIFNNFPKVQVKRGTILANELLQKSLSNGNFIVSLGTDNTVIVKEKIVTESQQRHKISGIILNELGQPLPGATILEKGTNNSVQTDFDGKFIFEVRSPNAVIVISYLGYANQEITLKGQSNLSIKMLENVSSLNEVVVVGYGSQRKKDVTGAISSVNVKDMLNVPTNNVSEMLRGRVAGVEVTIGSSRPGGDSNILIRGKRSLSGSNSPLFVVDGSPVNDINDLNANDIKSVEVLKDAASQAIYGARASAGVILVTTKRGLNGKTQIDVSMASSIQSVKKNFDLMTGVDWLQMRLAQQNDFRPLIQIDDSVIENLLNDPIVFANYKARKTTDWLGELIKPALLRSANISIRGGNENTKYSTSFNYTNQDGMIQKSSFERITGRLNLDQKISNKIKSGVNLSFTHSLANGEDGITNGSSGTNNMFQNAITLSPYASPYNDKGELNQYVTTDYKYNPIWNSREASDQEFTTRFLSNVFIDWEIAKGLKYRLNSKYDLRNQNRESYQTRLHQLGRPFNGWGQLRNDKDSEWLIENILTYDKEINDNNRFDITLMQSTNKFRSESLKVVGKDFLTDFYGANGIESAKTFDIPQRSISNRQLMSYLFRLRYTLFDKYIFSGSVRYDGSSVFGIENKWGLFPSFSAAWRINEEAFLKNSSLVSNLKLRLSYGEVGNQGVGAYQTTASTIQSQMLFGGSAAYSIGLLPGNIMPNPFLKWEKSASKNVGLDYGFFNDKLTGSIEWYDTRTTDLLVYNKLATSTGYSSQLTNLGEVQNTGIEVQAGTTLVKTKDFNWGLNATFTKNRNKIVKIDGKTDVNGNPLDQPNNNWFIGHSIDAYYEFKPDGIFNTVADVRASAQGNDSSTGVPLSDALVAAKVGTVRVVDINGDKVINELDRQIIDSNAKWIGSLSTTLNYKGFELFLDFYTVQGVVKNNTYLYDYNYGGTYSGGLNGIKRDYWTPSGLGQEAPQPKLLTTDPYLKSLGLQDASYVRLRTISLGYTMPKDWIDQIGLTKLNVFANASNYFTSTKYQSFSPESSPSSYPEPKMLTIGVNASF